MSIGPIYYGQPVNRAHPLNRGLSSWWLPLPWYSSGPRLVDIAGRSHATLVNSPAWSPGPTPFSSIRLNGTSNYATVPADSTVDLGDIDFTWILSFLYRSGTANFTNVLTKRGQFAVDYESYILSGALSFGDGASVWATSPAIAADVWHHAIMWNDATANQVGIAVDGGSATTAAGGGFPSPTTGALGFGFRPHIIDSFLPGSIQSVQLFRNRVLSSAERAGQYDQWRRGFPDLLSRIADRVVSGFAAGGGPVTETPSPIVATVTVVGPTIVLTQSGSPVVATYGVVNPVSALTSAQSPIVETGSVVAPAVGTSQSGSPVVTTSSVVSLTTQLVYGASPIVSTGSVVTPSTGGDLTETPGAVSATFSVPAVTGVLSTLPDAVVTTGSVVTPASSLTSSPSPIVTTGSVVTPSSALAALLNGIAATFAVPAVTTEGNLVETPGAIGATASVPTPTTALLHAPQPITGTFTVPAVVTSGDTLPPIVEAVLDFDYLIPAAGTLDFDFLVRATLDF